MTETATEADAPANGQPLVRYSPTESEIARVRADLAAVPTDLPTVRTPDGMQAVKTALAIVTPMRTTIEKTRVQLKAESLRVGRLIDSEAKRLTGLILEIETPIRRAKEAVEAEEEARARGVVEEQERKEAAERKRVEDELAAAKEKERQREEAERAAERQKLAEERAELDRLRAKQNEELAEAKRVADAERAAEDEKHRAAQAEIDRVNREAAAEVAAQRKKLADEQAALKAEQDRLDRVKWEADERVRLAAEAKEQAERDARETEERRQREAKDHADRLQRAAEADEIERKAEELARPDRERVRAFGETLAAVNPGPMIGFKTRKAVDFLTKITTDLAALADRCKNYR